jgi:alcohol dehydrogenase (cytochrome c)
VTDAMLRDPPASDWLMWRRTYNGWGYSPLDQINKDNVKNLQVAWTWSMVSDATETTPIVHDGVLYIFNYSNKIQALNAVTGDLIWEYKRDLPEAPIANTPNLSSRNMAIYEGTLIAATSDAHLSRSTPRLARWCGITPQPIGPRASATRAARSWSMARSSRA